LKLKQNITGLFRPEAGARYFAIRRSVLENTCKRWLNTLDVMEINADELVARLTPKTPVTDT
ncbi:MAG: hypothetical protein OXC02_11225, partial [Rhodobacteraceae bacterium]|nr:hypothetical protein [Paracoccaceae bacterium]